MAPLACAPPRLEGLCYPALSYCSGSVACDEGIVMIPWTRMTCNRDSVTPLYSISSSAVLLHALCKPVFRGDLNFCEFLFLFCKRVNDELKMNCVKV